MIRSLTVAAGLAVVASSANAGFVGGKVYSDSQWNADASAALGENAVVFRMFACFDSASDRLLNVFDANFDVKDGTLFQNALGGDHAGQINSAFFPVFPDIRWDSYVSAGKLTAPSTTSLDPNFNFTSSGVDGNSGWFNSNPPNNEGQATAPGMGSIPSAIDNGDGNFYTFIGQFTVLGLEGDGGFLVDDTYKIDGAFGSDAFNGSLSLSWNTGGGTETLLAQGVNFEVPTPGAAALLGLAGLTGLRRRR